MRKYGWKPDIPDHRDHVYAAPRLTTLPPKVDLSIRCPSVLDQGELGSCTANSIANAHLFAQMKETAKHPFLPSRLFVYYNERLLEGTVSSDSGASIRDGIKSIAKQGVCPEVEWPYLINKFKNKPTTKCYTDAKTAIAVRYQSVSQNSAQMRGCIAAGYPFVMGFTVYESFESDQVTATGVVPMPGSKESALGGHAVLCVGYDDTTQRFLVMNSWGVSWGMKGYFTIPYAYLLDPNLSDDFWQIDQVLLPAK